MFYYPCFFDITSVVVKQILFVTLIVFLASSLFLTVGVWFHSYIKYCCIPVSAIIPHHEAVKDKRKEMLKVLAAKRPITRRIVLLTPDHFTFHQQAISYTDRNWNLSNGMVKFDTQARGLIASDMLLDDQIAQDHGIYNVLPDLKDAFGQISVIPIAIGQSVSISRLKRLSERISTWCKDDCFVVASVDFSHYLPSALADIHDEKTIRDLTNFTVNSGDEVDSYQSLWIAEEFAKSQNAFVFTVFAHTNSAKLEKNRDAESTSHVFGWYRRRLFGKKLPDISGQTFLIMHDIGGNMKKENLGDRFFYGTDIMDTVLDDRFTRKNLIVEGISGRSKITIPGNNKFIRIGLGDDMAIAGDININILKLIFLPISLERGQLTLIKGDEKTQILNKLFSDLTEKNGFSSNRFEGIIELQL